MNLGERIQQLRKTRGISQEALAERVGVSRQAVSKWEQDLSRPSTENLLALAEIFGVSADELAGLSRQSPAPNARSGRRRVFAVLALFLAAALAAGSFLLSGARKPPEAPGEFALLRQTGNGWEVLTPGPQENAFPFGTSLVPTGRDAAEDTDYAGVTLHAVDCGALSLRYTEGPEGSVLLSASTIAPGCETPRGIRIGSTASEVLSAYGDGLVYQMKDSGTDILCAHEHSYVYSPADAFGTALIFYMDAGQVAGLELRAGDDRGGEAWAVDHVTRFPVKDGRPDFSRRTDPEAEELDPTRQVYIAWNALTTDTNLSAEDTYRLRQTLYENLRFMDWPAYGKLGEAGRETQTIMDLLFWLGQQQTLSRPELTGLLLGGAGRSNLDGAYADGYSTALAGAFLHYPEAFCEVLSGDAFTDEEREAVTGLTCYGFYSEQMRQQALAAADDVGANAASVNARAVAWDISARLQAEL